MLIFYEMYIFVAHTTYITMSYINHVSCIIHISYTSHTSYISLMSYVFRYFMNCFKAFKTT